MSLTTASIKKYIVILFTAFKTAFDTVKCNFLKKMKHYGFSNNFKKWITILYNDSESFVTNNGYLSPYFKLS